MHIALFADTALPARNGVATAIHNARAGLLACGHRVTLVTVKLPGSNPTTDTLRVPAVPYFHGLWIGLPARLNLPSDIDLIHTHTEFTLGWMGRHLARTRGLPHIHTAHTRYDHYRHYAPGLPARWAYRAWAHFLSGCAAVVCPSENMQNLVRRHATDTPTLLIPNGLDVARFRPALDGLTRADVGLGTAERVLLSVGRLAREKRPRALLAALAPLLVHHPAWHLLFVGDGPLRSAIQRDAHRAGIGAQVHVPGGFAWEKMPNVYRLADVYVSASLSENHPMTVIEAAAAGLPLVAREGITGAARTDDELAAQVQTLLSEPSAYQTAAEQSTLLAETCSTENHIRALAALYATV
ncbi:MAG: glycosyltransferase [Anaerolineales bacterium]